MTVTILFPPSLGVRLASARATTARRALEASFAAPVGVEVASDYAELEAAVVSGAVDLAWAPPAICAEVAASVAAIYKAVRRDSSSYFGAIVSRGGIGSLEALAGKKPAWVDRLSAAGYLLPRALLRTRGIEPERDLGEECIAGSYVDAVEAVMSGRADFTALYVHHPTREAVRLQLAQMHEAAAEQLQTIAFTEPTASDGLLVTHGSHRSQLEEVLGRWCMPQLQPPELAAVQCFDAQRFERASAADYRVLRRAT